MKFNFRQFATAIVALSLMIGFIHRGQIIRRQFKLITSQTELIDHQNSVVFHLRADLLKARMQSQMKEADTIIISIEELNECSPLP